MQISPPIQQQLDNTIFKARAIRKTIDTKNKNLITYCQNMQKVLQMFGFERLRPHQEEAVASLLKGEDLLYVVSTGGGKSLTYIITGLAKGYKTIIFSPLISLIQDQADKLKERGVRVGVVTSSVTSKEKNIALSLWENDDIDFLFVAPERLQNEDFMDLMRKKNPDFVVIDEIHCAYEHSDSFRASYKLIAPFIKEVSPKQFLGLTATMSSDVEKAVREVYDIPDVKKLVKSYKRENLKFTSLSIDSNDPASTDIQLLHILNSTPLVPSLVYCSTAKQVEGLHRSIGQCITGKSMAYTGQMLQTAREANQSNFIKGNIRVAFATNAFGMGVDKPDIGRVVFRSFPGSVEELIQGFGRGGRNGCNCECILMGDFESLNVQQSFIEYAFPSAYMIRKFFSTLETLKDPETGLITATLVDISRIAGINDRYSGAISQILQGSKVIKREEKTNIARIKFLDLPDKDSEDKVQKRILKYIEKIDFVGIPNLDKNYLNVDLEFLSSELGVDIKTVKKNLKDFNNLGIIAYTPPPNSQPISIIGDINQVNFTHLERKRAEKEQKLKDVIYFYNLPDTEKADYIMEYFKTVNQ